MKNITFKFYSVLKNEDAMPYIGGDLLVAADGLGGSGSAVHTIDREKHPDMRRDILSSAFGDIETVSPWLEQYMEELIAPMTDGKDDTSALWASRIAIARCVYALQDGGFKGADLSDEGVRADLADFIVRGLRETAIKFNLQNGKYDGQLLLPTTLAFIRYTEQKNSVIAETVWAGDSRLYALTPAGLKILSVDDEDESGAITNLFYDGNIKVRLNYLRHKLAKPCALMAVSDGVFDPFDPHDHLGVEHTVLSAIMQEGSARQTGDSLKRFYDSVHGDDATMAFVSFGSSDFADMQRAFKKRANLIMSIHRKFEEMHSALEAVNLSEEEATHYVASRTADRYDSIIPMLVDAAERGENDVAIVPEIRKVVEAARKYYIAEADKARRNERERALAELDNYVRAHPELVNSGILNQGFRSDNQKTASLFAKFKKVANDLTENLSGTGDFASYQNRLAARKRELHALVQAKIDGSRQEFDDLGLKEGGEPKKRRTALHIQNLWSNIDISFMSGQKMQKIEKQLPQADRGLADDVKNHINEFCLTDEYIRLWAQLFEQLKKNERLACTLLGAEARRKFGFDGNNESFAQRFAKEKRERIIHDLKERKTDVAAAIVKAFAANFDKESLLDGQYNATRLALMRTYYRLKHDPDSEVKEFEEQLFAVESAYTSMIK